MPKRTKRKMKIKINNNKKANPVCFVILFSHHHLGRQSVRQTHNNKCTQATSNIKTLLFFSPSPPPHHLFKPLCAFVVKQARSTREMSVFHHRLIFHENEHPNKKKNKWPMTRGSEREREMGKAGFMFVFFIGNDYKTVFNLRMWPESQPCRALAHLCHQLQT